MITQLFTVQMGVYVSVVYHDTSKEFPSFEIRVIDTTNRIEEIC